MFIARADRSNFASGEINSTLRAADDLQRYRSGVAKLENFVVLVEAILTRRPGTRFIAPLKDETQIGRMVPFRYAGNDYYMLLFNGGVMRLGREGALAGESPGLPFELAVPWNEAQLRRLRSAASGNTILQTCAGLRPQIIKRNASFDWSIEPYVTQNGPVEGQNLDKAKTIQASDITGDITMTGDGEPFDLNWVEGIIRLDEPNQAIVAQWQPLEQISAPFLVVAAASSYGDMSNVGHAFDGDGGTAATKNGSDFWIGASFAEPTPILTSWVTLTWVPGTTGIFRLYGKNGAAPSGPSDGVLIATMVTPIGEGGLTGAGATVALVPRNVDEPWEHMFCTGAISGGSGTASVFTMSFVKIDPDAPPVLRRWQKNIYQVLTPGNSGTEAPTHTEGEVRMGGATVDGVQQEGIVWRFLHDGGGYVRITSVTDTDHAAGTVLTRLPESVRDLPTYRYWPPAWADVPGWPENVQTFKQRFVFSRDNTYWMTVAATIDDFKFTPDAESAIARRLIGNSGALVDIQWMMGKSVLVLGTRDTEWITRAPSTSAPFSALNIDDDPETEEGSAPQVPSLVDRGVIFIGRSRQRLHYLRFTRLAEELAMEEISVASRHIWQVGAVAMAWQRDPHRILWVVLANGDLAAFTFMPDEKVLGAHRHPMVNCFVEDIASQSTLDDGKAQIWLQTRRTINGETRRYYEVLTDFFKPQNAADPSAEGAWFLDCARRYQGPPVAEVAGLGHLEGQLVGVFADGAQQSHKIVTGGKVTLDTEAGDVLIGLRQVARVEDLPRNITNAQGTSKGLPQRASHLQIMLRESVGGEIRINDSEPEAISDTGGVDYAAPMKLETITRNFWIAAETAEEVVTELVFDNAFPVTILGLTSGNEVEEGA